MKQGSKVPKGIKAFIGFFIFLFFVLPILSGIFGALSSNNYSTSSSTAGSILPFTTVKSYESGVKLVWGKVEEEPVKSGFVWFNPISSTIQKVDMRERKEEVNTTTTSQEGLKFGITITVRYKVDDAVQLVNNLQTPLNELVTAYANATIDDVATGSDKSELYSDQGRIKIVNAVKEKLNVELDGFAEVVQVIFEDITLPQSITEAIERQQAAEEEIKQKEKEVEIKKKEAEIREIEAQSIANANTIIQESLSEEYLQYEAIQKLNPSVEKIYIPTEGLTPVIQP